MSDLHITGNSTKDAYYRHVRSEKLIVELRERANSYRLGGPSSEHTALLLEAAASEIDWLLSITPKDDEE